MVRSNASLGKGEVGLWCRLGKSHSIPLESLKLQWISKFSQGAKECQGLYLPQSFIDVGSLQRQSEIMAE